MSTPRLSSLQRSRLDRAYASSGGADVAARLQAYAGKGIDVAAYPFQLLDHLLSENSEIAPDIGDMGKVLPGGQPDLFRAITAHLLGDAHSLAALQADTDAHPKTRWEARGWSVFLTHRAALPEPVQAAPANLVQFWEQPDPPPEVSAALGRWVATGLPHKRFDTAHATRFITRNFGSAEARIFSDLWHPALQSDVFRLFYLCHRGGLYADADTTPGPALTRFAAQTGNRTYVSAMTRLPDCATLNHFIAAPAASPVLTAFLDHVLQRLCADMPRNIFWLSGPGAFTQFLATNAHDIHILPFGLTKAHLIRQFDAPYKQTPQNWRVFEHGQALNDDAILREMFPE